MATATPTGEAAIAQPSPSQLAAQASPQCSRVGCMCTTLYNASFVLCVMVEALVGRWPSRALSREGCAGEAQLSAATAARGGTKKAHRTAPALSRHTGPAWACFPARGIDTGTGTHTAARPWREGTTGLRPAQPDSIHGEVSAVHSTWARPPFHPLSHTPIHHPPPSSTDTSFVSEYF